MSEPDELPTVPAPHFCVSKQLCGYESICADHMFRNGYCLNPYQRTLGVALWKAAHGQKAEMPDWTPRK